MLAAILKFNPLKMSDQEEKEERYRIHVTQGDIREIKRDVTDLAAKINDIHVAFVGSPLAKDGGIMKRIEDLEIAIAENRTKIDECAMDGKERMLQTKIIWSVGGALALAVLTIVLQTIFHVKK